MNYADASQNGKKAVISIFLSISRLELPAANPGLHTKFHGNILAIALAVCKVPQLVSQIFILSDAMSVISALTNSSSESVLYRTRLFFLPRHVKEVRLAWVLGHTDISGKELANDPANFAVRIPVHLLVLED